MTLLLSVLADRVYERLSAWQKQASTPHAYPSCSLQEVILLPHREGSTPLLESKLADKPPGLGCDCA